MNDTIEYRGWTIARRDNEFLNDYKVIDQNGFEIAPDRILLKTVKMAKNMIDRYFKIREGKTI